MTEGYVIIDLGDNSSLDSLNLLAHSINRFDDTRSISFVTNKQDKKLDGYVKTIVTEVDNTEIVSLDYFTKLMKSPYDRTIVFMANQLLTDFTAELVWESLRGLGPVVFPKTRMSYAYENIPNDVYWKSSLEEKSFGFATILNMGYFDKTLGSDDVLGLAVDIASSYDNNQFIAWLEEFKNDFNNDVRLPAFPENLWPEWVMSFVATVSDKVKYIDLIDVLDLSRQENNIHSDKWSLGDWNRFLNYWINDLGQLKIENFIQLGLINYSNSNWLDADTIYRIKNGL